MCGIAGFEARDDADGARAARLADALANRGPDAAWTMRQGEMQLVQTRLSIIDLSPRVRYPMPNEDRTLWLLFNGEIYNHKQLRAELESRGHRFATSCDAEVVVHAWEQWGEQSLPRLAGMFALALFDQRSGELALARDRLGIKPLVYTVGERFAFSSDALALVEAGLSSGEPDPEAIVEFALLHFQALPLTGISDLRQVEPGELIRRSPEGEVRSSRFAPPVFSRPPTGEAAEAEVDSALRASVERQLEADVEVGVLLSSGIDSSLLLSYVAELGARPTAFTVGFQGHGAYDERPAAARLAASLGIPHVYDDLGISFADALERVQGAYDVPFADSSAIATLELARLARERVTVVLSGTGGDDLFGGYYRHRAHRLLGALARAPAALRRRASRLPAGRGGERSSLAALATYYLARLARADTQDPWRQYLDLLTDLTSSSGLALLRLDADWPQVAERIASRHALGRAPADSTLRELQRFELLTYVPGDLLVKEDRATMAVGLEGRVPLLDDFMVAAAERTPDNLKVSALSGKRVLRALARKRLPGGVARARKRGFAVPLADLMRGRWRAEVNEWARAADSELLALGEVPELIDLDGGPADAWALLALAAWEQRLGAARRRAAAASGAAR